ncbi:hypothetical protein ACLKA7_001200 [Drosophila subpalustris]
MPDLSREVAQIFVGMGLVSVSSVALSLPRPTLTSASPLAPMPLALSLPRRTQRNELIAPPLPVFPRWLPRPALQSPLHLVLSQRSAKNQSRGTTIRPIIDRSSPDAVRTIYTYGFTGKSNSSASSRQPRPKRLTDAPESSKPRICRPPRLNSAKTRGSG